MGRAKAWAGWPSTCHTCSTGLLAGMAVARGTVGVGSGAANGGTNRVAVGRSAPAVAVIIVWLAGVRPSSVSTATTVGTTPGPGDGEAGGSGGAAHAASRQSASAPIVHADERIDGSSPAQGDGHSRRISYRKPAWAGS